MDRGYRGKKWILLSIKEKSLFNKSNSYLFFNLIKLRYNIKKSEELKNKSQMYNLVNEKIKYSLNAISDKSSYSKLNKIVVSLMKLNFNFVVFYDFYNYKRAK